MGKLKDKPILIIINDINNNSKKRWLLVDSIKNIPSDFIVKSSFNYKHKDYNRLLKKNKNKIEEVKKYE